MSLTEYIQGKLTDILDIMVKEGVPNFQLAAAESLAEQQFEALLTSAQAVHHLVKKFAGNPVICDELITIEDNLLRSLGLMPDDYLAEIEKLERKLVDKLELAPDKETKLLEENHQAKVLNLRRELKVDEYSNDLFSHLQKDPSRKSELLTQFKVFMEDNWVEADMDVAFKQDYESRRAFELKKELNAHFDKYHKMLEPYVEEKQKIIKEYDKKRDSLLENAQNESGTSLAKVIERLDKESQEKERTLEKEWDQAKDQVSNLLSDLPISSPEDTVNLMVQRCNEFVKNSNDESLNAKVGEVVLGNISQFKEIVESCSNKEDARENLIALGRRQCNAKEASQVSAQTQALSLEKAKTYLIIQNELAQLELDKSEALDNLYKEHKSTIDDADVYYTKEIEHRKRIRKCEQVNQVFALHARNISKAFDSLSENNPTLDSHTTALFAHLQECYNSVGMLMNVVNHAGDIAVIALANTDLGDLTEQQKSAFVENAAKKAIETISQSAKNMVSGKGVDSVDHLQKVVDRYDREDTLAFAEGFDEQAPFPTLLNFMPQEVPEPLPSKNRKNLQDLFKMFREPSKFGMAIEAYQAYSALTATNPRACFEDTTDMAQMLFNALEDEKNDMHVELINVLERGYETLLNSDTLNKDQRKALEHFSEKIDVLQKAKNDVELRQDEIISGHSAKRDAYAKVKSNLDKLSQDIKEKNDLIKDTKKELTALKSKLSNKEIEIASKSLEEGESEAYEKYCSQLDDEYGENHKQLESVHVGQEKALGKKVEQKKTQMLTDYEQALEAFDLETQNQVNNLIIEHYAQDATNKSWVTPYYANLAYAKTFSQEALDEYLKNSSSELKADVEELIMLRKISHKKLQDNYKESVKEADDQADLAFKALKENQSTEVDELKYNHVQKKNSAFNQFQEKIESSKKEYEDLKDKIADLEVTLSEANSARESDILRHKDLKEETRKLSAEYFRDIKQFKEQKQQVVQDIKGFIQEALSIDADPTSELYSLNIMVAQVFNGANMFDYADLVKGATLNFTDYAGMDINQVLRKQLQEREVKDITANHAEQSYMQIAMVNLTDMLSKSTVGVFCEQPLMKAKLYVQHLKPTLEAQQSLKKAQAGIHKMAPENNQLPNEAFENLKPNPYMFPSIRRALKSIGRTFRFLAGAVTKGVAYASIQNIIDSLKMPDPIVQHESQVGQLFDHLRSISDVKLREKALVKIQEFLDTHKIGDTVNIEFQLEVEFERIKLNAINHLNEFKSKGRKGPLKYFSKESANNRLINSAIDSIKNCQDYESLSQYISKVEVSNFPLHQILEPIRKELDSRKLIQEPKPGDRLRVR